MNAEIGELRLKSMNAKEVPRMVVPSVRVKSRAPNTFTYEPLENSSADFLVGSPNQNIRSLNRIQANEPIAYFEIELRHCK